MASSLMLIASAAFAGQCDVVTARVMHETAATFERSSTSSRFLRHPLLSHALDGGLTIYCGYKDDPQPRTHFGGFDISLGWHDAFPPKGFFDLATQAGAALTQDDPTSVRAALV